MDSIKFKMRADGNRAHLHGSTGVYVRAIMSDGEWGNADVAELDKKSLHYFLTSRGGNNPWAEDIVAIILWGSNFSEEDMYHPDL